MMPRVPDLCTKLSPSCHLEPGGTTGLSSASVTRIHITTTKRQQSRFSDRLHHGSITTSASQKPHDNLVLPTSPPSQPHQFSRPARRMIPQLSQLKSHLRKNTSEPANKPPEALTSPCSPPGPSRRNATSTPLTCSRPPTPLAPQLTSSRCKETRCTRHTSPRFPTPLSPPGTPAPPRGRVTPRASSRSPVQVNDPLRPRRSPTLRQPTRTKAEQAAHFQSIHDTEDEEWLPHPRLTAANLHRAQQIAEGGKRSPYTTYMFSTALPEPVRKRKPSLTQPTRTRAERVAAGDCMGHGCFSAFCATSCAFERPEPAYSLPQFVTMSTEPDIDQTLSKPKTNYSLWTSIKQIRPIDPTFSKSGKKESFRRFIKDLVDCLKACGKLLLVAVGCNCVLK